MNESHGLTEKDANGRTKAHPLYWVWREKRKHYEMDPEWDSVATFVEWALDCKWEKGNSIRRHDVNEAYSPANCYVHVRGTALGVEK